MSLSFSTSGSAFEVRWIVYALLRDNVQHHLEGGKASARFSALHGIAEALGGKPVTISAAKLHQEIAAIQEELAPLPVSELALAARTRSVIDLQWPKITGAEFEIVGAQTRFGAVTPEMTTLGDVFTTILSPLFELTENAGASEQLEVSDL